MTKLLLELILAVAPLAASHAALIDRRLKRQISTKITSAEDETVDYPAMTGRSSAIPAVRLLGYIGRQCIDYSPFNDSLARTSAFQSSKREQSTQNESPAALLG